MSVSKVVTLDWFHCNLITLRVRESFMLHLRLSPIPTTLQELHKPTTAAETDINGNMLLNFRMELDYHLDVCQMTKGVHIEHV